MQGSIHHDIDSLRERLEQLERLAFDYARVETLIELAAEGRDLSLVRGYGVLYADAETQRIVDADALALNLLGYSLDMLTSLTIPDLEIPDEALNATARTFIETSIKEQAYLCSFRHRLGHPVTVQVHKRLLPHGDRSVVYYRLEEKSLRQQVWHELQRREDQGFVFQQKLKALNEITVALSRLDSYDALCYHAIQFGREKLGFDRLGLWLLDSERGVMQGSYGTDEQGIVRPEHDQRWSYADTYVSDFLDGQTDAAIAYDDSPIYNEKSEIIEYGWHITAPMLNGEQLIGVLTADNYLHKQPMKFYEPELLRLYAITIGHLTELAHGRDQAFAMRWTQEHSDMLRHFITAVGHDFKTPLSIINTKTYLMERAQAPDQRQTQANGIQEQVRYISLMLDRMLEFLALETHSAPSHTEVNLYKLLLEVCAEHQAESDAKHILVEVAVNHDLTVTGDADSLRRALSELFENAVHYTPEGGWVRVTGVTYSSQIGMRIQDNGIGIEAQRLTEVFKPLYRIDPARTERRAGLGLAIAKTIVEAHQGRILVESSPNNGSTFEVILPRPEH